MAAKVLHKPAARMRGCHACISAARSACGSWPAMRGRPDRVLRGCQAQADLEGILDPCPGVWSAASAKQFSAATRAPHLAGVVVDGEACLVQLRLREAGRRRHLPRVVHLVGEVLERRLRSGKGIEDLMLPIALSFISARSPVRVAHIVVGESDWPCSSRLRRETLQASRSHGRNPSA